MISPDRRPGLGEVIIEKARSVIFQVPTFVQNLRESLIDPSLLSLRSIENNKLQALRERLSQAPDNRLVSKLRRFRLDEGLIMGVYLLGWGGIGLTIAKAMSEGDRGYNIWGTASYGEILLNTLIAAGLMKMVDRRKKILFEEARRRPGLEVRMGKLSCWADRIVPRQLVA